MRLGFKIAVRFLKSNIGQTFIIVLGIAVGVSVQIFIGSLIQGLQKSLVDKTIGSSSHITISTDVDDKELTEYEALLDQLTTVDPSIEHISAASDHAAFLSFGENSQSVLLRGFDLAKADQIYHLTDSMEEGRLPETDYEIILGIDLKDEYGIILGDAVTLVSTAQKEQQFKVVGFYDLKVSSINKNWGIITLQTAQEFNDTAGKVTSIEIQVVADAVFDADIIAEQVTASLNDDSLNIDNWKAQNEQLLSGLQGQSISSLFIQVFVMISVVLGIASVLAITVMQKSRQIGILKAMGIKNLTAGYVFLFEGMMFGVLGALLGIGLGLGLSFAFTKFALNPDGTPVVALYINPSFIMLSGLIAMGASILAASIPAIRSSKLNPIDIIRNN